MVKELGADAIFVRTDVSKSKDVEAVVAKAVETFRRLDCAFNNAGIGGAGRLTHEYSEEEWNRVIAINLTGVWLCMKAEITQMLKQNRGAIVNTSSIMGLVGAIRVPAYTAAKHGVAGLTKAAALEYGRHGIRVNAVCPAPIYTPMLMGAFEKRPDMEGRYARSEPLKRLGQPRKSARRWLGYAQIGLLTLLGYRCRSMAATWRSKLDAGPIGDLFARSQRPVIGSPADFGPGRPARSTAV
jgi:NAD(P)-dependent dehydrogenase (short-subunit alcohol dehydrogenase family)